MVKLGAFSVETPDNVKFLRNFPTPYEPSNGNVTANWLAFKGRMETGRP